jgi:ectoine hydroxylase-related dioxygenase (phytanoyl-CoA dioxygenase family)
VDFIQHKTNLINDGFTVIDQVFSFNELSELAHLIDGADNSGSLFRKTTDLFAIRQVLKELPQLNEIVFNVKIREIIRELFGDSYFVVKSIYFDKPGNSNWFVAYHQDLTISVDQKLNIDGFGPWTVKQNQYAVQPPLEILQSNFTIRVHLDDTNENNGALKVIPSSHHGINRPELIDWSKQTEVICDVNAGGVMIMKPLILHASNRTTNDKKRRVLHIEFSEDELPDELNWSEKYCF